MSSQFDFFAAPEQTSSLPPGFRYAPAVISVRDEAELVEQFRTLPFQEFDFHGYKGNRRVVSFGHRYDFSARRLLSANEIPAFLHPARVAAATFAGVEPGALPHALVTEYTPGAGIGWHKDKDVFDEIVGLSLLAPCTFRLRRRTATGWDRVSVVAEPRSAYLLSGPARTDWEHSIPAVDSLRYSITFRTLRAG